MFYSNEILKKEGKFGIIWLAATASKRIKKKDIHEIDVCKTSNDVIEVLTQHESVAGKGFSLYLSSQLMYGLTSLHNIKTSIFLNELKTFAARICTFCRNPSSIDLDESVRTVSITLDEPDFENVPIDFGCFAITDDDSVNLPVYDFFIVRTSESTPDRFSDSEDYFLTMQEAGLPDPHVEQVQCLGNSLDGWNVGFPESFLSTANRKEPEALSEPEIISVDSTVIASPDEKNVQGLPLCTPFEYVPRWILSLPDFRDWGDLNLRAERTDYQNRSSSEHVVLGPTPSRRRGRRKKRKNLIIDKKISMPVLRRNRNTSSKLLRPLKPPSTPESLVLEPVPPRGRGRRKGHLIIDKKIEIPMTVLRRNMKHNIHISKTLPFPLALSYMHVKAKALLSTFGLSYYARENRRFFPNLQTLPEPNDPSAFGFFREHYDSS